MNVELCKKIQELNYYFKYSKMDKVRKKKKKLKDIIKKKK